MFCNYVDNVTFEIGPTGRPVIAPPGALWARAGWIQSPGDARRRRGTYSHTPARRASPSLAVFRPRPDGRVWDLATGHGLVTLEGHADPVYGVAVTADGQIRWMNVTEYLRQHGKETKQIVFDGEPFTALNLVRLRDKLMG